ncbi:hypothetical protein [Agromyces archimandritae]|uniref:Uncharacterized protein n=1 Tax=Agromyces archimandritae TaxID=2781962 RepID=A0A975IMJ8_9MICO|nr:hypothetical protein [Agromyces archimandritae]QTX03530.1 hypothetical protein G127AT_09180 [Agromyces archimandritae]
MTVETNWAGNLAYRGRIRHPSSVDELRGLVADAPGPIRPLGTRHSFNTIVDTDGTLIATDRLPTGIAAGGTVPGLGALRRSPRTPRPRRPLHEPVPRGTSQARAGRRPDGGTRYGLVGEEPFTACLLSAPWMHDLHDLNEFKRFA